MRIQFDRLDDHLRPSSTNPAFSRDWQIEVEDEGFNMNFNYRFLNKSVECYLAFIPISFQYGIWHGVYMMRIEISGSDTILDRGIFYFGPNQEDD